jgi:16S rRNA (adenine1518-N6/adenine1519-N6)-dimethyltransferase
LGGRKLGQHFLFDRSILARIAAAACGERAATVIEIGPGPGGLTAPLLERCERLIAIEIDPALAARLREKYAGHGGFTLVEGDVLRTDLARWGRAVVCGNLPYYIASPVIAKTLALGPLLERAVFLVQKEAAVRLAAAPGSRDYGYLSAATQFRCQVERLFAVKPASFRPPPKVESAVVRLTPHAPVAVPDPARFLDFVSACFRRKRKNLRNNLAGRWPGIASLPEASLRAEQLGLAELARLFSILEDSW